MSIDELAKRLKAFADERDWEQFHTPKNLAIALSLITDLRMGEKPTETLQPIFPISS